MRLKSIGNVGQIVRDLRKSKRLTQGQLAAKVDTNQEWISNLETGRIRIQVSERFFALSTSWGSI